jgi:pimeloyl-ACP methyl ester carboxylesterase
LLVLLLWLVFYWLLALASLILFNFGLARFFERLAPPRGRFIEVDGVRLHVVDSGVKPGQSGPPLLFLHGLLGQLNHFSFALAALFPERRVVLLDRPGSGFSQAAPSQSLAAQADLAAKVIALLNLDKPLVVGHSFGGAVGLALALDHPESVGGLALVAPLTHPFSPPGVIAGLGVHNRLARWLGVWTLGPIVALARMGLTQRMVFAPDSQIPGFWTRAGGFLAMRPSPMLAAGRELRVVQKELTGMAARYAALTVPAAVLFGDGDVVLDPKAQGPLFCAKARRAELTMVHGGHMLPMTQPKTTESFIRDILARLDAA